MSRSSYIAIRSETKCVADLDELRIQLGDDQVILLGHSMGGYLAQAYAGCFPGRCERLVLAGTWPTTVPSKMLPSTFQVLGWARSLKNGHPGSLVDRRVQLETRIG